MLWFDFLCLRVLIPLLICACITIRPAIIFSVIYSLYLFVSPHLSLKSNRRVYKIVYLSSLLVISIFGIILQACSANNEIRQALIEKGYDRLLGIIDYNIASFWNICQIIIPDFAIALSSLTALIFSRRKKKNDKNMTRVTVRKIIANSINLSNHVLINQILMAINLITLCISGGMCTSLVNMFYFMVFLISSLLIAANYKLEARFSVMLKVLSIVMVMQITALFLYQIKYFQELLPDDSLSARLIGLYEIISKETFAFNSQLNWDSLLQPMVLMVSYLIIANTSKLIKKTNNEKDEAHPKESKEESTEPEEKLQNIIKRFIIRQAYVITIFSMMIWSIAYFSWLAFIFLMTSNIIFIFTHQRKRLIWLSPFISIYACILILISYVYSMKLNNDELPVTSKGPNLEQIGLIKYNEYPGIHLIFKSILMIPFLIAMRQKFDPSASQLYLNSQTNNNNNNRLTAYVFNPITKVMTLSLMWIIILVMFIMAVFQSDQVTMFSLANMLFFLTYILLFQISNVLWRKTMYLFWIVLIIYTKIILILTYIFQFDGFIELPYYKAIGLQKYKTSELFLKLLSLITITMLSGIQLNYCHSKFVKNFEKSKTHIDSEIEEPLIVKKLKDVTEKILLFIEIHFVKIFYCILFWVSTKHIQIVNLAIMVLLTVGISFKSERLRISIMKIISFISMLFIIGAMLYQLSKHFIEPKPSKFLEQCQANKTNYILNDFIKWFNVNEQDTLYKKIEPSFTIIVSITVFFGLKLRQEISRIREQKTSLVPHYIFDHTNIDVTFLFKFLIDHGYEAFGTELIFLAFFNLMFTRLDIMSVLYVPFLIFLIFKYQHKLRRFWLLMICVIAISIIIQCMIITFFVMVNDCHEFQQSFKTAFYNIRRLRENSWILANDFFLLVAISCQFTISDTQDGSKRSSNFFKYRGSGAFNGLKKFLKEYLFRCQFWILLSIIFLIGTYDVKLFSLGYIGASFIFFWQGNDFYSKPLKIIKQWWNAFFIYNVCIIIIRYTIKILVCVFQDYISSDYCWILKILDVPCAVSQSGEIFCRNLIDENSYILDIVLFFLIFFQKRIFSSLYFYDTIYDTYITNLLAARGAQIMEDIRIQEITSAIEEENRVLEIIKKKMEIITHLATLKNIRDGNIESHDIAVRNGDYYMFEDDFVDETESLKDDYLQTSLMLLFSQQEESRKKSQAGSETFSDKSKEVVGNIIQKSKNFKVGMSKLLLSLTYKLHKLSRKRTLIIKALQEERKFLKEAFSPTASKEMFNSVNNPTIQSRHNYLLKKIDEKFWEKFNVKLYETVKPGDITLKDSFLEVLYIALTHTDLLIYLAILVNQCFYANMLSLYLPLSIFFWATLTFPRPQKTFWILLIAYTQCIIFIKCVLQFKIVWWDKEHPAMQILGIDGRKHFVLFDMLLLIALFVHRSVQKVFGIWKTDENGFFEGCYELENNEAIKDLIRLAQRDKSVVSNQNDEIIDSSNELLENKVDSKIIFRHEIQQSSQEQEITVKEVLKDRKEFLGANEDIFVDAEGKLSITITQENNTLKLYPINTTDTTKHYAVDKLCIVEHVIEDPLNFYSSVILMSIKKYSSLVTKFLKFLVPKYHIPRKSVDVYTFCFLCDFINFFVLLFGFSKFAIQSTDDSKSILNYFEENKVPTSLLVLIIMQFVVIIIDRMLYLRKNMLGKVIYHYIMIITIHCWMFFFLPIKTKRKFNSTSPTIIFYIIKFIYFLLSAYQIRCGYPARVLGNFLMRKYNMLHLIGFKIFMVIPFLFELRTLIDWTFTSTSLSFAEWMRVETVYAQVFKIKCMRIFSRNPKRGVKKSWFIKLLLGGGLTLLIIGIVWFPLLLFAYSPSLGQSGVPKNIFVTIEFENHEPIYKIDVRAEQIVQFRKNSWNVMKQLFEHFPSAHSFLEDFDESDVILLKMNVNASSNWNISPPNLMNIIDKISNNNSIVISASYEVNELGYLKDKEAQKRFRYKLNSFKEMQLLLSILKENSSKSLVVKNLLPKFLHIGSTGKLSVASILSVEPDQSLRSLFISKHHNENGQTWWKVREDCYDDYHRFFLQYFPYHDCENYLNVFILTEKLFPSEISSWAAKGILGFYITVIVFCSRILRNTLINSGTVTIIVEELPSVDKILNLCKNIYMVREAKQFSLEEDLVAKLLFLYRSPETLIKWTKYKES